MLASDGASGHFEYPHHAEDDDFTQAGDLYRLMDASMAVDELVSLATEYPQIRDFHYWAQLPGESVESGSARIQYMADKVIPQVTVRLSGELSSV